MQPYALTHSFPLSHNHYPHSSAQKVDSSRRVKRRKQGDVDQDATEEEPDSTTIASSAPRARPRGDYYRRRDMDPFGDNSRHRRRVQKKGGSTLADARAEHVLLAARKVGRERASVLAGAFSATGRDRDKDLKNDIDQADAVPKTPRKNQAVGVGNGIGTGVIYLNSPIPATADTASVEQVSSDFSPAQTPLISRKSARSQMAQGRAVRANPLTSLDSLLTAASTISMIEKEDADEDDGHDGDSVRPDSTPVAASKPSTQQTPNTGLGSPAPTKRRRVASSKAARSLAHAVSAPDGKGPSERLGRMRSALDVLADQAAVFSSQDHDSASSKEKGKGKGKAKAQNSHGAGLDDETLIIGESVRQKPPSRDRAPHQVSQATSHRRSISAPSPPTQPAAVMARDHDPSPPTTSEIELSSTSQKRAPPPTSASPLMHPPSIDTPRGAVSTPSKAGGGTLSGDPSRTDNGVDKEAT